MRGRWVWRLKLRLWRVGLEDEGERLEEWRYEGGFGSEVEVLGVGSKEMGVK